MFDILLYAKEVWGLKYIDAYADTKQGISDFATIMDNCCIILAIYEG